LLPGLECISHPPSSLSQVKLASAFESATMASPGGFIPANAVDVVPLGPMHDAEGKAVREELRALEAESAKYGRLQVLPKPLQADHVIDNNKQLFAVTIGHAPDKTPLKIVYDNYKHEEFLHAMGDTVVTVCESIPHGGVLVFFPSYSLLNKCKFAWGIEKRGGRGGGGVGGGVFERMVKSKKRVICEQGKGTQAQFEFARDEYAATIKRHGSCILLAVFRGKMSEGISFNDENARCVICLGVPNPR